MAGAVFLVRILGSVEAAGYSFQFLPKLHDSDGPGGLFAAADLYSGSTRLLLVEKPCGTSLICALPPIHADVVSGDHGPDLFADAEAGAGGEIRSGYPAQNFRRVWSVLFEAGHFRRAGFHFGGRPAGRVRRMAGSGQNHRTAAETQHCSPALMIFADCWSMVEEPLFLLQDMTKFSLSVFLDSEVQDVTQSTFIISLGILLVPMSFYWITQKQLQAGVGVLLEPDDV